MPFSYTRTCPGRSSSTPRNTLCGGTTVQNVKVCSMPTGSSSRGMDASAAKIDFTSLPK